MVDLDSNPTKLIEIVEIGKQLLITRGALTTFSIANDVAKYFAMLPAMFSVAFPVLNKLNILCEGHRRARRGTDVVVGYVETHGRVRTAELLEGLEVVPRKTMTYGARPSPSWTWTR